MTFTSTLFLFLFLPIAMGIYYLARSGLKNIILVAVSLLFYAVGEPRLVWLLIGSIAVNYLIGLAMESTAEKKWLHRGTLLAMLAWNFGTLFYYKYFIFSIETVNTLFGLNIALPVIGLPLGISFFTFRTVSYGLDVHWGTVRALKNPIDLALYVSFFPQVTMGPIDKYANFEKQLHGRTFDKTAFIEGIQQIIAGLFKKLFFSNSLGMMVDRVFEMQTGERTVLLAWLGIVGYMLQLYYDFAGYSDIAIGLGKLFGFKTPQNFDYPYISKSVVEFWNRWHMTLGAWLKDYIYTPVFRTLMDKKSISIFKCNIIALFVVWLFAGVWHGAGLKFIVYGLYYFVFIALERTVEYLQKQRRKRLKIKKKSETKLHVIGMHVYLLVVILFGQLLFRADSLAAYWQYIGSLFGTHGAGLTNTLSRTLMSQNILLISVGAVFCLPVARWLREKTMRLFGEWQPFLQTGLYLGLFVIAIAYAFTNTYQSFIYFQF